MSSSNCLNDGQSISNKRLKILLKVVVVVVVVIVLIRLSGATKRGSLAKQVHSPVVPVPVFFVAVVAATLYYSCNVVPRVSHLTTWGERGETQAVR